MPAEDQLFRDRSQNALDKLQRSLEKAADSYEFDVDRKEGALTVEFEDPPTRFVVSPNSPVKQIWVSALVRSFKLDWSDEAGTFVLADGRTLETLLAESISTQLNENITL